MLKTLMAVVVCTASGAIADQGPLAGLDDRIHQMTTKVEVHHRFDRKGQGSGFFYAGATSTEGLWLVTNRHVILGKPGREAVPYSITLYARTRDVVTQQVEWTTVSLSGLELEGRTRTHPNAKVDVALIDINGLRVPSAQPLIALHAPSKEQIMGNDKHLTAEVGDDVLVIGYPDGFYDHVNQFPIVKSGIIASKWGAHFAGEPYFLIDAKLLPGSSGSVVVSKPVNSVVTDSGPRWTAGGQKAFALLGVYSGGWEEYDLGMVWYGRTIEEARLRGLSLSQAVHRTNANP